MLKNKANERKKKRTNSSVKMKHETSEDEEIMDNEPESEGDNGCSSENGSNGGSDDYDSADEELSENEKSGKNEKQVQIYFTTNMKNEKYKIENTTYTVPVNFKRIDLSRMIKKLLGIKENISFEFLINKKILRCSLEEFLKENNILSENVLRIEYTLPITKKGCTDIDKISEWISKLVIIDKKLYCSTFEGSLLYYDLTNFNKINEKTVTSMPIFSFNSCKRSIPNDESYYRESVIGLSNGTIKVFLNEETNEDIITKNELYLSNHDDMIKSIEFNKDCSLIISGGSDKKINIYDNNDVMNRLKEFNNKGSSTNKRKMKNGVAPVKCIHKEPGIITTLSFFDNTKFLCTGIEKNIKIYDAKTGNIFSSFSYDKSVMCSDILSGNLFAAADEQSVIKLFDVRCLQEKSVISLNENKYYFHDKIITSLQGNKNELYFLSASHDGYINIYDIRLNKLPVYTIENKEKSKILSCTWFYNEDHHSIISADEHNLSVHNF
ncbi:ribosome biogenesis protein YTM1, putative [Plasmodium ovale]|uniref:Ribosome biogenesis protein YTM1, putative n=2 Tax=Plasmodium ovale TaxID=36330 RepID=A0A1D3TJ33_PLAOA|nr:ribosome biogenesis protein YTM1, putative (YTM1) [Plasmodium ovale curtisi]SBS93954.1 ribosome biogenesis protein YTM1, putative (YTM1) [Plasmodium ovale curtisi]SCP04966.1 ribosome biogenesis protein YTM1, putative [Plasmodium ovale]